MERFNISSFLAFTLQLENALKSAETAQAALTSERANSSALLMTEEEIKSLQLQVILSFMPK